MNHSQKIITKCDGIITNCDSLVYYKARWTLQIATAFLLQSATPLIGGFHVVSGDTNNNGEMKNAGGQTKRANERSFVYRPPAWRR